MKRVPPVAPDQPAAPPATRLLTVEQVSHAYPAFTVGSLRWLLFNRQQNGLAVAVRRIGRRVLLDEASFLQWLESHREGVSLEIGTKVSSSSQLRGGR